eukprot:gene2545-740_t
MAEPKNNYGEEENGKNEEARDRDGEVKDIKVEEEQKNENHCDEEAAENNEKRNEGSSGNINPALSTEYEKISLNSDKRDDDEKDMSPEKKGHLNKGFAMDYLTPEGNSVNNEDKNSNGAMKKWQNSLDISDMQENEKPEAEKSHESQKQDKKKSKQSPFKNAFFISKWMQSLFSIGYKKVLDAEDLYDITPNDSSSVLCEKLEREWYREAYDENGNIKENASIIKVIFRVFGWKYMLLAIPSLLAEGFRLAQPVFLGMVTEYFSKPNTSDSRKNAYLYSLGLCLCALATSLNMIPLNFTRQRIGMRVRIAMCALVYKKILRLSNKALSQTTTGHIVNLVSVDAQKLDFAALFLHYLWISPIIMAVSGYLLWQEIGVSSLSGLGLLLLLAPLQMGMGKLLMNFRRQIVKYTDRRVKVMNEVISGMRVLKLYTWEDPFTQLVESLRNWKFINSKKGFHLCCLVQWLETGHDIVFPIAVTLMNEGRVSLERMQKLLLMDELRAPGMEKTNLRPRSFNCQVTIDRLHASWTKEAETLKDISLTVGQGELAAIVGPVGSGKSSLLMAMLGELAATSGTVNTSGKIAFVSQEAWIFNGTLKNNITFGQELNEKKYRRVIEICALEKDIEMLPQGDMSLVGERGVSLSGGQKARVNLARAVYFDADIYILDDPLSAVDAHVGRHLFDQCINGYLSNKVRILVTHQLQYISDADQVLVLSEGKCLGKGSFDSLLASGIDFMSLLQASDDQDSAVDTDIDDDGRARSFSRQESGVDETRGSPNILRKVSNAHRKRTPSAVSERRSSPSIVRRRKESILSHNDPDNLGSDLSVASKAASVKVFEERNMPKEFKFEGAVTYRSYLKLFRAGFGLKIWILVLLMFITCQGVYIVADWWLSRWTNEEEKNPSYKHRNRDLGIYAALVICLVVLGISRAFLFFHVMLRSSRSLHDQMFRATLRAPLRFFDTNSIGRILNRFSKDTGIVDDMFSFVFFDFIQTVLIVLGIVLLVCANNPVVFAWATPVIILFLLLRYYYIKTAREVKRIEGLNRSPLFGNVSTTLLGLPTIRAFRVQERFFDFHFKYQDEHTKSWFAFIGSAAWLACRLEILSLLFISFVLFISVALRDEFGLTAGQVGLILAYTINITGVFQQCVRQSTEFENHMTSVERILEYCDLPPEAPPETDTKPPAKWPDRGSIRFQDLSFCYADGLPYVLKDVNCHIKSSEKIGVCGRTGAGKSEPSGKIIIDGMDITQMGLKDLRSKISIIPQDPVLFGGSMRKNLDPFSEHSDADLWNALEEVQLKDAVEALPGMLESQMAESGSNLSVGQRQLVCLARAVIRRNKILVIDEATANVDPVTDALIQTKIREKFKDCTVLTIAHRLNTIMDSDRIMVLDAGRIKEFDKPYNLLKSKNNLLYKLVAQTGGVEAQKLFEAARKSHFEKKRESLKKKESNDDKCGEDGFAQPVDISVTVSVEPSPINQGDNASEDYTLKIAPETDGQESTRL